MKNLRVYLVGAAVSASVLALGACDGDEPPPREWSQFRGPAGLGISDERSLPEVWAEDENVRWRAAVPGLGSSAPVVSAGQVFVTTATADPEAEDHLVREMISFDLASGLPLWRKALQSTPRERIHRHNSPASATPVADGQHVFAYFGSFLAKVARDGTVVWIREVDDNYRASTRYGLGTSPVLAGGLVILFQDQESSSRFEDVGWLAAYDQETGEERWRQEWENTCCSYTTPLVYDDGELLQVLVPFSGEVASYEVATGERLWSQSYKIHQIVPSLVLEGDILCATGGGHRVNGTACMRLHGKGRQTKPELLWQTPRLASSMPSPVLYQGRLYVLTAKGILVVYEPETGKILWQTRLGKGPVIASLVAGDGKIYATNSRGTVFVVAAEDEYRLISENVLEGGLRATPAIADGCLLLRTKRSLFCVGPPGASGTRENA